MVNCHLWCLDCSEKAWRRIWLQSVNPGLRAAGRAMEPDRLPNLEGGTSGAEIQLGTHPLEAKVAANTKNKQVGNGGVDHGKKHLK